MNGLSCETEPIVEWVFVEGTAITQHAAHGAQMSVAQLQTLIRQTRDMVRQVHNAHEATVLVRRAAATEKLTEEVLKGCRLLDDEQFQLRQEVAEVHIRTQRRAGEILLSLVKNIGGRPPQGARRSKPATLRDLGIERHESHRWQRLAGLPEEELDRYVAEYRRRRKELTTAGALAHATSVLRQRRSAGANSEEPLAGRVLARYRGLKSQLRALSRVDESAAIVAGAVAADRRVEELAEIDELRAWLERLRRRIGERGTTDPA